MDDGTPPVAGSELECRFQNLVDNIPGLVVYLDVVHPDDPTCSFPIHISPQFEALLGYPREAWLNEDELWLDVLHPDDRERMVASDIEARSNLTPVFAEYRMIAQDGRVVWVSEKANVVTDEITGTMYWQGVMVDITDRKLVEEALAASERQYRSVFDAATIGLLTLDLDGRVLEANSVVERVLTHLPGALVGSDDQRGPRGRRGDEAQHRNARRRQGRPARARASAAGRRRLGALVPHRDRPRARRSGRAEPPDRDDREHRWTQARRSRARAPHDPRCADAAAEPAALSRAARRGTRRPSCASAGRRPLRRPRQLQARQRHARPRSRQRSARRGGLDVSALRSVRTTSSPASVATSSWCWQTA